MHENVNNTNTKNYTYVVIAFTLIDTALTKLSVMSAILLNIKAKCTAAAIINKTGAGSPFPVLAIPRVCYSQG